MVANSLWDGGLWSEGSSALGTALRSSRFRLCVAERKRFQQEVGEWNNLNLNYGINVFSKNCSSFQEA